MKSLKFILIACLTLLFAEQDAAAQTASVKGIVYNDANADGEANPGETVVEGTTVTLIDCETGAEIATVVTGEDGSFSFEGVAAGTYLVQFTYPSGLTVQTRCFPLAEGQSFRFNAPVVTPTQNGLTTSPDLSLVNPGNFRTGFDASGFAP